MALALKLATLPSGKFLRVSITPEILRCLATHLDRERLSGELLGELRDFLDQPIGLFKASVALARELDQTSRGRADVSLVRRVVPGD